MHFSRFLLKNQNRWISPSFSLIYMALVDWLYLLLLIRTMSFKWKAIRINFSLRKALIHIWSKTLDPCLIVKVIKPSLVNLNWPMIFDSKVMRQHSVLILSLISNFFCYEMVIMLSVSTYFCFSDTSLNTLILFLILSNLDLDFFSKTMLLTRLTFADSIES